MSIDDDLLAKASELTGESSPPALIREGLRALIERESARRLALLGGTAPELTVPTRRRPAA